MSQKLADLLKSAAQVAASTELAPSDNQLQVERLAKLEDKVNTQPSPAVVGAAAGVTGAAALLGGYLLYNKLKKKKTA